MVWLNLLTAVNHLHSSYIWLEGDASSVISSINISSMNRCLGPPILNDILRWKANCSNFIASHTCRCYNRATDFVAKLALQDDFFFYNSGDSLNQILYLILQADLHETSNSIGNIFDWSNSCLDASRSSSAK